VNRIPEQLLQSLENLPGFDREPFLHAHADGQQLYSIRMNPAKREDAADLPLEGRVPWCSEGFYLSSRPAFIFDPLLHAGVYYVQEASSMFLEQAIRQTSNLDQSLRVLDLCAAPGGKSTLLQSILSKDSLLVSNEVIKSRASILEENLVKWGAANTVVTNNDAAQLARLPGFFDIIVADAPCSGSGLFRKDPDAISEWSDSNVNLCSQRQQRILSDIWPALKPGGLLVYSTCSYSKQEDEDMLDWLAADFGALPVPLRTAPSWGIVSTNSSTAGLPGYRFYPDKLKGEGFFIAVLRKPDGDAEDFSRAPRKNAIKAERAIEALALPWIDSNADLACFLQGDDVLAFPRSQIIALQWLQSACYLKKAGINVGRPAGKELIPHHELALSLYCNSSVPSTALNKTEALQYLRRDEMQMDIKTTGWQRVTYKGHSLGWVKALPRRINNYYPKEWRILKQPG
jgi:16S rRNA C967 or C1407 C5-methylase (RsmB/RsmF family)/NOL1/NOP2/fmu family ribosome biogenesis protein